MGEMKGHEILVALRRIMRAIDLHSKHLEKRVGLTVPQLLLMQEVSAAGELSGSHIARRVNLSPATVTSVLDRLEAKGLVQRSRHSTDRRVVSIELTEKGRNQLENAPGLLQERFVERYDRLEPWEQKMLTAALERIASLMDAEQVDAAPILQSGELLPENAGSTAPTKNDKAN